MKTWVFLAFFLAPIGTLLGQIEEQYSDGDFTQNPSWEGDTSQFVINNDQQLQLQANSNASPAGIYTGAGNLDSIEWRFWVKPDFPPSNSNQLKVILGADSSLDKAYRGYYLLIGENGNNDAIDLYRSDGTQNQLLVEGIDGFVNKGSNAMRIRVKRQADSRWTIYADSNGRRNFVKQGSGFDSTYDDFRFLGFQCHFTATRSDKFFFDDVYYQALRKDTSLPELKNITVLDSQNLLLEFDEPIASASRNLSNIRLSGNPISTDSLWRENGLPSKIRIRFGGTFKDKTRYKLLIDGFADNNGNALKDTFHFNYVIPRKGDIVINEFMADPNPSQGLPTREFVEVYNKTGFPIDLSRWKLADASGPATIEADTVLPAKEYGIICDESAKTRFSNFGIVFPVSGLPSLNNGGDVIILTNEAGDTINQVNYDDTWYGDNGKSDGGWTLERINLLSPCKGSVNWGASKNPQGGTPGRKNAIADSSIDSIPPALSKVVVLDSHSLAIKMDEKIKDSAGLSIQNFFTTDPPSTLDSVTRLRADSFLLNFQNPFQQGLNYQLIHEGLPDCWHNNLKVPDTLDFRYFDPFAAKPGDVLLNEFMPDPTPSNGLPKVEYIEILNTTNESYSLRDWEIKDKASSAFLPDSVLKPSAKGILCSESDYQKFDTFGKVIPVANLPSLNNNGDQIVLQNPAGWVIDSISYSQSWYRNGLKRKGGWALELINPAHPCSDSSNWRDSENANGGTPGKQNSVFSNMPDTVPPGVQKISVKDSNTLTVAFSERVKGNSLKLSNWSISGDASISSFGKKRVLNFELLLKLNKSLTDQQTYTLQYQGIMDCWGNKQGVKQQKSFEYLVAQDPLRHELLVTEIMADPLPAIGLPEQEYLEVKNVSDKVIALDEQDFLINNNAFSPQERLLKPDSFLILTEQGNLKNYPKPGNVLKVSSMPALPNGEGVVTLRNGKGKLIHSVFYDDQWYGNGFKKEGGWSLEMKDPASPCLGEANWAPSSNKAGGTPGYSNSVETTNPDTRSPEAIQALVMDSTHLKVFFDERMDSLELAQGEYSIDKSVSVSQVEPISPGFKQVILTLSRPLEFGKHYSLTINEVFDCAGNGLEGKPTFTLGLPKPPEKGDLLVNEILFDPPPKGADYVEIYNRSDKVIDWQDLRLAERNDSNKIIDMEALPRFQMLPGQYAVVTPKREYVRNHFMVKNLGRLFEADGLPSYNNQEDEVVLTLKNGEVIDEVHYQQDWHAALVDNPEGVSLERIAFDQPSMEKANWHSAAKTANFGTPTYENSQAGEAEINASPFKLSPKVFSPDQDGYKDFLKIHYKFDKPGYIVNISIYDSKGRSVTELVNNHLLGKEGRLKWDGTLDNGRKAPKGVYILLIEAFHPDGDKETHKLTTTLGGSSGR